MTKAKYSTCSSYFSQIRFTQLCLSDWKESGIQNIRNKREWVLRLGRGMISRPSLLIPYNVEMTYVWLSTFSRLCLKILNILLLWQK